jgi:predicted aldo/keto reductase-like oxidoreductase
MWEINWKTFEEFIITSGGLLDEACRAKEKGLTQHISFSFHDTPKALVWPIDSDHFESMIVQHNLLD